MTYLAVDLGADSGRVMAGRLTDRGLQLSEVHRFPNVPVSVHGTLHWNILGIWHEIQEGLRKAAGLGEPVQGLGLDTWGCDFGLLDAQDRLLGNPVHYRDARTNGILEEAFRIRARDEIFACTGIQFIPLNTLYQLLALKRLSPQDLQMAASLLMIPDLLNFWLTGVKAAEFSIATTTQCFDPSTMDWSGELLAAFELPESLFQPIVHPGYTLGPLLPDLAAAVGLPAVPVTVPACHDTGSAVAAVPSSDPNAVWISSGTWSIMGVTVPDAVLHAKALAGNFTNEGGVERTFRFCKNIMGLWLIQECRRTWMRAGETYSYAELGAMVQANTRSPSIVDPDHEVFLAPGDMPLRLQTYCRASGQPVPETKQAILSCIVDSLALKYRWVLTRLEDALDRQLGTIHVVGGGSQHSALNQATADATGRPVVAGPAEATATGNILIQAVANGAMDSFGQMGTVSAESVSLEGFEPATASGQRAEWDASYQKLEQLVAHPVSIGA